MCLETRDVDITTANPVGEVEKVVAKCDDELLFGKKNAVPIHQRERKRSTNAYGLNTDRNKMHRSFLDYAFPSTDCEAT